MPANTLILGLDGSDHRVIDQMIASGDLPNFLRLKERSKTHLVKNDAGQGNVGFWTCAAIGAGPAHHARYFYMQFDPKTYDIVLRHKFNALPDLEPFWATLDKQGYRVSITDWYNMPVTPMENGVLIYRWMAHEPLTHGTYFPPEMSKETAKYVDEDPIAEGFASRSRDSAEDLQDFLTRVLSRIDIKAEFFSDQLKNDQWDGYIACLSEPHNVGHYYMHIEDEQNHLHNRQIAKQIKKPIQQCYRRLDTAVGKIMDAAGADAEIFVIGGPGMERFISANSALEEITRRVDLGYGAPVSGAEAAKNTYRSIIPESLRRQVGPLARAVRRRFANREYLRRRFFALPNNDNAGTIRVNLKGREKHGTVAPGAEYDALVAEITEGISSFKNADTDRSIVKRVVDARAEFDGPYSDFLPDIFVEWERTETFGDFKTISSEKFGDIELSQHSRTGDHTPFGFFWEPKTDQANHTPTCPADLTAPMVNSIKRQSL